MSQSQLAENAGVSQQYVSELERGMRNPTIGTMEGFARALKTTPAELFKNWRHTLLDGR
jgi:transcriptional regulator with XRE-family HTH domain